MHNEVLEELKLNQLGGGWERINLNVGVNSSQKITLIAIRANFEFRVLFALSGSLTECK